jgi:PAS domain-containing protein
MFDFVHPEDRQRTLDQNLKVRSGGQALDFENRYRCKDGSYRWLLWNATADLEHEVIYSVARDITERKRADEERERLLRELQAALAEVRELQKILPICSYCRNIRDDENYWQTVESYISHHTNTRFSHGICPACFENVVESELGDPKNE